MSDSKPGDPPTEAWLRGPIAGIPSPLQPVAHAMVQAREDVERAVAGLTLDQLRARPAGVASLAFHLIHIPGSIDRLLTYAGGQRLSDPQRAALRAESDDVSLEPAALLAGLAAGVDSALARLREWPEGSLADARTVGRAGLPSTVGGLLFHAAEHAQRHAGQVLVTARLVRSLEKLLMAATPAG
jgi:uncharacterized damage-inducible protein DinB